MGWWHRMGGIAACVLLVLAALFSMLCVIVVLAAGSANLPRRRVAMHIRWMWIATALGLGFAAGAIVAAIRLGPWTGAAVAAVPTGTVLLLTCWTMIKR